MRLLLLLVALAVCVYFGSQLWHFIQTYPHAA
jgi:hypothetical protein